ncbi:MAG: hypothetical protein H6Q78_1376 [Candidatus Krumholzibacteriota bacterium]|nr:hypothetical protein [Candidatus Krumholzibacteriota bacterium]
MELSVPARLRTIVSEHRPDVAQARHPAPPVQAVLEIRAYHRGRVLGTQGQTPPAAVAERVHLLRNDVRRLTD